MRSGILMAIGGLALFSGFALGDSILENGGAPTFTNVPSNLATGLNSGIPYWDNHSGDFVPVTGTNTANVGYFLTAAGNFSGGTNYNPNQYVAAASGSPDAPAAFNLVHSTNSLLITLIGLNTGSTSDVWGIYNIAIGAASEIPLFNSGTTAVGTTVNESAIGFTNVGFYISVAGATWFSQTSLNVNAATGDTAGHQHFSIFTTASDPNKFFVGTEDWVTNAGEGVNGDFNDMIVQISASTVPEPATFALMGAGLLGLGFLGRRLRK